MQGYCNTHLFHFIEHETTALNSRSAQQGRSGGPRPARTFDWVGHDASKSKSKSSSNYKSASPILNMLFPIISSLSRKTNTGRCYKMHQNLLVGVYDAPGLLSHLERGNFFCPLPLPLMGRKVHRAGALQGQCMYMSDEIIDFSDNNNKNSKKKTKP